MILTAIIKVFWTVVSPVLAKIPSVQINYDGIASSGVYQYLRAGLYFFPMDTVLTIGGIVLSLWILRIVIAVLHSLWASLPIV